MTVEARSVLNPRYREGAMAGKKNHEDATKQLPPDEPTLETDKGLKIGLPKRSTVMDALRRVAKADDSR